MTINNGGVAVVVGGGWPAGAAMTNQWRAYSIVWVLSVTACLTINAGVLINYLLLYLLYGVYKTI